MKHNWVQAGKRGIRRGLGILLAAVVAVGGIGFAGTGSTHLVQAEERAAKTITAMNYFSAGDGPVISASGVGQASYGFVMPLFNGGGATWEEVAGDLTVDVKVGGTWINIDSVDRFVYNSNWGNWSDGGFHGYWFTLSESTVIRLISKSNPGVNLEYTLNFTNLTTTTITSLSATQGPIINAGVTGGSGFTYPVFNGDASIQYAQVASDLKVYIWSNTDQVWVDIDNNAASGWIYDSNFGQFTDGGGGYWFTVTETTKVRLASKTSGVYLDYTINYADPVRNTYTLSAPTTTFTAGETGAIGVPLPMIDGGYPVNKELDNFVYEIKINGVWEELSDYSKSGFSYQGNGYNKLSDKNQWGYWVDGIYGLWFQPIQVNMELRFGYPENGVKGGSIGNNYVNYTFIGNPDAPRPDVSDLGDITVGDVDSTELAGWNLLFNDEFTGNTLNMSKWNYNPGYYINGNPNDWGWGNGEMEYYTESEKNIFVQDGSLNLKAYYEPTTFPEIDPNRVADYSSGKITSKDKLAFKYGRIDFRAKLPKGNGIWPALWMLPNDDIYGPWAASGELDVMEARGRLPGASSGALHFGGAWPANTYIGSDYSFPEGETIDTAFHVYSVVWEEDNIKWYVDGTCFFKATNEQWFSAAANGNINAPFDQEFYIIMNLAVGGWFDGGRLPNPGDIPATMLVDYVRVYQEEGSTNGSHTDNSSEGVTVPVSGVRLSQSSLNLTEAGAVSTLSKTVLPADATNQRVTWTSSNPQVASVDQSGKVTAVSEGTAVITVTTADGGKTASCVVTVTISGEQPGRPIINVQGNEVCGLKRTDGTVEFYVKGAAFADLHYKLNGGGQINVAMNSTDGRNYTYTINGLNIGDTLEYSFTYNPGQGALDTPVSTFTLPAASDSATEPEVPAGDKISAGKTVLTSGDESEALSGRYAVDGDLATRWGSGFSDDQWITVDLGKTAEVNKVVLIWEPAYGKKYNIQVSQDAQSWTTVKEVTDGKGGTETIEITPSSARYVRMQGVERALPYGYSLFEMEVYGTMK